MSRTKFIVLGIIALVLAVVAIGLGFQSRWQRLPASNERFFPDLESHLNDVTRLQVQIAGFDPVTVTREGDRWGVADRDGYPVDTGLLRRELLTLAELKRVEAMTSNPDKYERLGLRDLDKKGSEAREIKLWAGDKALVQMFAGKSGPGGGSYLRLKDDPQSWLSSAAVNSPSQPADWLEKELLSVTPEQIQRIQAQTADGTKYTLSKADRKATAFTVEPVPEGKRAKVSEIQRISGALNALRMDDVVAESKGPKSDAPWSKAEFDAFDGLVIEAQTRKVEGKDYLKLSARFDEELAKQSQQAAASKQGQEAAKPTPALDPPDKVKAQAEQLAERFKGWLYIVPTFKAELFGLPADKLFENPPKPAAAPAAAQPIPAPAAGPAGTPEAGAPEAAPEAATPGQPNAGEVEEFTREQPAEPGAAPAEATPPATETQTPAVASPPAAPSEAQPDTSGEAPAAAQSPAAATPSEPPPTEETQPAPATPPSESSMPVPATPAETTSEPTPEAVTKEPAAESGGEAPVEKEPASSAPAAGGQ
ncbi:MAG: DUF4340 domain-containing protein [Gammaproteobacteria bacterium]|nr:DUF4340 domain-containing protein [Gammaproteobacteria bacterium]MCP5424015.1 DUF4340 domain-containing protein [Gammaproteobacteria bacterium]MCP5459552.1 DUF4340 domain-containing protein [Gammaproteobacteria bacterium]